MRSFVASILLVLGFTWFGWFVTRSLWRLVAAMRKSSGAPPPEDCIDEVTSGVSNASEVAAALAGVLALIAAPSGLMAFAVTVGLVAVPLPHRLATSFAAIAGACAVMAALARMYSARKRRASSVRQRSALKRGG